MGNGTAPVVGVRANMPRTSHAPVQSSSCARATIAEGWQRMENWLDGAAIRAPNLPPSA